MADAQSQWVEWCSADAGDDLKDHTDYAIWMGAMRPLDLSIFNQLLSRITHRSCAMKEYQGVGIFFILFHYVG